MSDTSGGDLSGGRFVLGLGSSLRVQVGPEHGVEYGKPLARVSETVAVVCAPIRSPRIRRRPLAIHSRERL